MQQQHLPLVKEVEFGDFWKNLKPTFWWPQNLYNDPDMNCEEYHLYVRIVTAQLSNKSVIF